MMKNSCYINQIKRILLKWERMNITSNIIARIFPLTILKERITSEMFFGILCCLFGIFLVVRNG